MQKLLVVVGGLSVALIAVWLPHWFADSRGVLAAQTSSPKTNSLRYDATGALIRPKDFETWIFVGASTGLSYEPGMSSRGSGEFKNVYIDREAYEAYRATGKFPEKTVLALTVYDPSEKVSPAKAGYFEGQFTALAFAVKDHVHAPEGWSYYSFPIENGQISNSAKAFAKSQCYDCHHQHAADDNVFVQFYPALRKIFDAKRKALGNSAR
jgi:hypothetical protein